MIVDEVWSRFGDPDAYCEPFCGSAAVFLGRPHPGRAETLNDASGHITNVWRAVQAEPETVAALCDWPINEIDLFARHIALVRAAQGLTDRLMSDPSFYDPTLAAWWIWGASSWIGSGWCAGVGPWSVEDGRVVKTGGGVSKQMPRVGANEDGGVESLQGVHAARVRGVSKQMPVIGANGTGVLNRQGIISDGPQSDLIGYFNRLSVRLRNVRVVCGDWRRILTPRITTAFGVCAVFLDPPYPGTNEEFYGEHGATDAWHAAQAWAIEHGTNSQLRIALCGLDDQGMPDTWTAVRWKRAGGYGSQGDGVGRANASREVVWFSPHCLNPADEAKARFNRPIVAADVDDYGPLWGRPARERAAARRALHSGAYAGQDYLE